MDALINAAQDDFTTFLKQAFQWSDEETSQNAPVMFPSLAGAETEANSTAAKPCRLHNNAVGPEASARSFMQLQAPLAARSQQHQTPFARLRNAPQALQQQQQQQAFHAVTAACGELQLPLGMTHIPSTEESAALSAQILLLQAQHQQQVQAQQWQQHLHTLQVYQPPQQQQLKHTTLAPNSVSTGELRRDVGSAGSAKRQPQQHKPQTQVPPRRGRPPKASGAYSKGYGAILRFRQKRKAMMEQLEQQLAEKQQQYEKLQAENNTLSSKFKALQGALMSQNNLIDQLAALNLSVGPVDVPTGVRRAGNGTAATRKNGKAANRKDSSSSLDSAEYKKHLQAIKLQELHKRHVQDVPVLHARYKGYVQACAAKLAERPAAAKPAGAKQQQQLPEKAQQAQQQLQMEQQTVGVVAPATRNGAAAPHASAIPRFTEDHTGFPPMPFDLVETLALFKVSRAAGIEEHMQDLAKAADSGAGVAAPAAAGGAAGSSSSRSATTDLRTINLLTGKHDPVSVQFWAEAAQQIELRPQQKRQLEASWELYDRAIQKLNADRQKLREQIQAAIDGPTAAEKLAQRLDGSAAAAAHAVGASGSNTLLLGSGTLFDPAPAAAAAGAVAQIVGASSSSRGPKCGEGKDLMAAGMAGTVFAVGPEVPGCFAVQRMCHLPDLAQHEQLADAAERTLMRGRAIIMAFGWSQAMLLDNEQIARISVAAWPYFPLMRAVVGHMLNKPEMLVA